MYRPLLVLLALSLVACGRSGGGGGRDDDDSGDDAGDDDSDDDAVSAGCGRAAPHPAGGVQLTLDLGAPGGGTRGFTLVRPDSYDPDVRHRVIVGYPGTSWIGSQIRPYLDLEDGARDDEIFVYPDPLWHDFEGWGNLGGWRLGPNAWPADGDEDLVFTGALLDWLEDNYCVDTGRVFATGHSWGGDMAQVVSCFLGDRFTATAPVAANRPYWFEAGDGWSACTGDSAVWTFFGQGDDHFTRQDQPGQFGDECRDFWEQERGCSGQRAPIAGTPDGECEVSSGCSSEVRYCLYGPGAGHQAPAYFASEAMAWFRTF